MTNREAIEWLKGCVVAYEVDNKGKPNGNVTCELIQEVIDMAISALEKQEQDRWIPVTERLPEKPGWYAITVYYEAIPEDEDGPEIPEQWRTGVAYWNSVYYWDSVYPNNPTKKERGKWWVNAYDYDGYTTSDDCITAWRPLPEPYTEEES